MNRAFSFSLIVLLLTNCSGNHSTFDEKGEMQKFGTPTRVEYFKHIEGKGFEFYDKPSFVITNNDELKLVIEEIKNADNPEPWKGAGWDRIKVHFRDTILNINTDQTKIDKLAAGQFYELEDDNFISKRLNK